MRWQRSGLVVALAGGLILPSVAAAQGAVNATLSVLAEPVERLTAGGGAEPGYNGMNLVEGDRIKTGANAVALITFLNGSTVTVLSDSDVTVKQAPPQRGPSAIRLLIHAGQVWARVIQVAGTRSNLAIESNEYAATAHDGLIGAERGAFGFICWSRRGTVWITNSAGQTEAVVQAGQRAWGRLGLPITPEPFVPGASMLEITASGSALPLLRMPDGRLAAGFPTQEVEVNQVFGALTEARRGSRWLVEVPAGKPGPYILVLTGASGGPFTVRIATRYAGFTVHRREITGTIQPGERLYTRIGLDVSGDEPRTARVRGASVETLRAWDQGEPAVAASPGAPPRPGPN